MNQQTHYPGLRMEADVTPRWFEPRAGFFDDASDIQRALGLYEGSGARLMQDVQIGLTGVRVVFAVPPGNPTDGFEAERLALKGYLDALDLAHPRRGRVTAQRRAEEERARLAAEAEAAARAAEAEAARNAADEKAMVAAAEAEIGHLVPAMDRPKAGSFTTFTDPETGKVFRVSDVALAAAQAPKRARKPAPKRAAAKRSSRPADARSRRRSR